MVYSRVSTYNVHQSTLRDSTRVQAELFNLQNQISSGLKAQTFAELNGKVEQFTLLDARMSRTTQFIENNKVTASRLNSVNAALDQNIQTVTDFKNLIVLRRNAAVGNNLAFQQQLEGHWKALSSQLNTSFEGRYLFSGTRTDTPAVDAENFPTLAVEGTPDAGYYTGSEENATVRIQDNFELSENVRADDPAYQKIFAAFVLAKEGNAEANDTKLTKAYDLLQEGLKGVIDLQTSVNANKVIVEQANEKLDALNLYWKGVKEEIVNTDIVSASTEVAVNQGILQASFQAFARINALQLSDYLR